MLLNNRLRLLLVCLLVFTACFLLSACGKKGDPTLKSYERPAPPSGLRAVHRESEIILSWDFTKSGETSIKGFRLLKSRGGDFEELGSVANNSRTYPDTHFELDAEYRYKVIAESLKGVFSRDSNILTVKPAPLPPPPENLRFTVEYDSLTLAWDNAGEGLLYNVYKSSGTGDYSLTPLNREPLKELSFKDIFTVHEAVFYTVRSIKADTSLNEGPPSAELAVDPGEFVPPPPEDLQAVPTQTNVYLIWKESPITWVRGYRVYRETDKKKGYIPIGETQTPSFLDSERAATKRSYRVTALGPAKEGPPAEIRNVIHKKR